MQILRLTICLLLLGFILPACKDHGPQPPDFPQRIKLTLIDAAVREVYLHVAVINPANNETLTLLRNGTPVMTLAAIADTNIADTALTQTTSYQYTATVQTSSTTGKSNIISAQTLAPTSHNFTWQTFLLGDGNNSSLSDVAIINDSLIYAVGEMYVRDSSGAIGDTPYNLAKWDGRSWKISRVAYIDQGSSFYAPIRWVLAVSQNDIWLGNGVHWDGQRFQNADIADVIFLGVGTIRMWRSSNGKLYVVGHQGRIAYSSNNGGTWQRLESGTTTQILDAWGALNPVTGKDEVYCAASSFFEPDAQKKILRISEGTRVDSIAWNGRLVNGIWTNAGYPLFTSGDGVFENKSGVWNEVHTGAAIFTNDIRGTGLNNIVAVGDFGFITHYNGIDWQQLAQDYYTGYATVRLRGNLVCAVGRKNAQGFITLGRRN